MTRVEQPLAHVRSDETRAAGVQEVYAPMMRARPESSTGKVAGWCGTLT